MTNKNDLVDANPIEILQNLILTFWGYRNLVIPISVTIILLGLIFIFFLPKTYQATASLVVEKNGLQLSDIEELTATEDFNDLALQTQKELLSARPLAETVIKQLSLNTIEEFNPSYNPDDPEAQSEDTTHALLRTYMSKLSISGGVRSRIIKISFESQDPALAARIVNAHIEAYLTSQINIMNDHAKKMEAWISSETTELAQNTTRISETLQALTIEVEHMQASTSEELTHQQTSDIEKKLSILNTRTEPKDTTQKQELESKLQQLKDRATLLQNKKTQLHELELEEEASQKLLDNLLGRHKEIQAQMNFSHPDARIVSKASIPQKAIAPNKILLLILTIIVAGMVAVIAVFFEEYRNSGLRNFNEIKRLSALDLLGILPVSPHIETLAQSTEHSTYKEAIKKIYMKGLAGRKGNSTLITSASPKEGRSTFVTCMAHYLISLGHHILIIDADFLQTQNAQKDTATPTTPGLTDILKNNIPYQETIHQTKNGLTILPAGNHALYSPDLLLSETFTMLIKDLENNYDYILIDAPPVLAQGDIEALTSKIPSVIMVVEWLKTKPENFKNAVEILNKSSAQIIGVVLNKVKINKYKKLNRNSDFLLPRT